MPLSQRIMPRRLSGCSDSFLSRLKDAHFGLIFPSRWKVILGIYTGLPASPDQGKSTLVKFVSNDPRFTCRLKAWAGGPQLVVSSFFSWNAGMNGLQKTHTGLLRTCLFEVLQQRRSLVSGLFHARLFLLRSFGCDSSLPIPNSAELGRAFRLLPELTGSSLWSALLLTGSTNLKMIMKV